MKILNASRVQIKSLLFLLLVLTFSSGIQTPALADSWVQKTAAIGPSVDGNEYITIDTKDFNKIYGIDDNRVKRYEGTSWTDFVPNGQTPNNGVPSPVSLAAFDGMLYAGTTASYPSTYTSPNLGKQWHKEDYPAANIGVNTTVGISGFAQSGERVFGQDVYGVVVNTGLATWERLYALPYVGFTCASQKLIFTHQDYLFETCNGFRRSSDGGLNWTTITAIPTPSSATSMGSTLYVAAGGNIKKSTDNGATWTSVIAPKIGVNTQPVSEVAAVGSALFVLTGGGAVFRTDDDGVIWAQLPNLDSTVPSKSPKNNLFVRGDKLYVMSNYLELYEIKPSAINLVVTNPPGEGTPASGGLGCGMCVAGTHLMQVGLTLGDIPVGYAPAYGPAVFAQLGYMQISGSPRLDQNFSTVGRNWSLNYFSYIEDDTTTPGKDVVRYTGGGGATGYKPAEYSTATGAFPPELQTRAVLSRSPATGAATSYTLTMPDGGKYVYDRPQTVGIRRLFLSRIEDAQGLALLLSYDSQNRLTAVLDALGQSMTFCYNTTGTNCSTGTDKKIYRITDRYGRYAALAYDGGGRLISITDVQGITSSFTYAAGSPEHKDYAFITSLTTPYGTSNFSYGENGTTKERWLELKDPEGQIERLEFRNDAPDVAASPTPVPDGTPAIPTGVFAKNNSFYWDKLTYSRAIVKDGSGNITSKDYTKATLYHWLTGTDGKVSEVLGAVKPGADRHIYLNYDGQTVDDTVGTSALPILVRRVLGTNATQSYSAVYNAKGFPVAVADPLSRITTFEYNANEIDLAVAKQKTTASLYEPLAQVPYYNAYHQPTQYKDAANQPWNLSYNGNRQLSSLTDPLGNLTQLFYDGTTQRLWKVRNANLQDALILSYDGFGRVATAEDSEGYTLTYAYDALDRVTQVTYPDASTVKYDWYMPNGTDLTVPTPTVLIPSLDLWGVTDRQGRETRFVYDKARRLTSVIETLAVSPTVKRTTAYEYYPDGGLENLVDANGVITHWNVDDLGRPTRKIYDYCRPPAVPTCRATSLAEDYTYDVTGRLQAVVDALGQVKNYGYNVDDTLSFTAYTNPAPGSVATPGVNYYYDERFPRLKSMTDGSGINGAAATTTFAYKALGTLGALQLASETSNGYYNQHAAFYYDALGRVTQRWAAESMEGFSYDAIGRLASYNTPLGNFSFSYLGQTGLLTGKSVTNSGVTLAQNYAYDSNANDRRLLSITASTSAARSYAFGYGYTENSILKTDRYNIRSLTESTAPHPLGAQVWTYGFDRADRLLSATGTLVPGSRILDGSNAGTWGWVLDKLDNATQTAYPTYSDFPTYNALNQQKRNAFWQDFDYDAAGNLTAEKDNTSGNAINRAYKYDMEGRLAEMNDGLNPPVYKVTYRYDGFGRRTLKTVTDNGAVVMKRTLWCGSQPCQERNTGTAPLRRYLATGEYVNASGGNPAQKLVTFTDHLGSARDVLDAETGSRLGAADYDPYGTTRDSFGALPDYRFAGLLWDGSIGLYASATRFYDPGTTRWMTRDWVGEFGGYSLYAYTGGNPVMYKDPQGTCVGPLAVACFGAAVLAGAEVGYIGHVAGQLWKNSGNINAVDQGAAARYAVKSAAAMSFVAPFISAGTAAATVGGACLVGSKALLPMFDAAYMYGSTRMVAGYAVNGTAGLVGSTYNINLWALYRTAGAEGLPALLSAFKAEAAAAGASNISISGSAIINSGLMNISSSAAARFGITVQPISSDSIIIIGLLP